MNITLEIELKHSPGLNGKVILERPNAGIRRKILSECEKPGFGVKLSDFNHRMMIHSIKQHPWGMNKITDCVDGLDTIDYESLISGYVEVSSTNVEELKKKFKF